MVHWYTYRKQSDGIRPWLDLVSLFFSLWMKSWSVFGHANGWLLSGKSSVAGWNMPHIGGVILQPATRVFFITMPSGSFLEPNSNISGSKRPKKKIRTSHVACLYMFHISWPIYHISLYGISWSYIMSDVSYIHIQIQVSMYGTTWYNLAGLGLWYLYHHWHCHCAFTAIKNGKRLMFTTQEWWRLVSYGKERFPQ